MKNKFTRKTELVKNLIGETLLYVKFFKKKMTVNLHLLENHDFLDKKNKFRKKYFQFFSHKIILNNK